MPEQKAMPAPVSRRSVLSRRVLVVVAIGILIAVVAGLWFTGNQYLRQVESLRTVPDRVGLNAPYITSPDPVVEKMVELADLREGDVAYDLGCGDGRILIAAALKTGCRGVGYDIDPERIAEARASAKLQGVEHLVEFRQQDIFTVDLSEADAVLMYVLPWMTRKLIPQLRQLQPGSRIVSHQFSLGEESELQPETTVPIRVENDTSSHYVHRWTAPLKPTPNVR